MYLRDVKIKEKYDFVRQHVLPRLLLIKEMGRYTHEIDQIIIILIRKIDEFVK